MSNIPSPAPEKARLHPILWLAAIAVTLFSLVGIAALAGWLPSGTANTPPPSPAEIAAAEPPAPPPLAQAPLEQAPPPAAPVAEKKAPKPAAKPAKQTTSSHSSNSQMAGNTNTETYSSKPAPPPPCPNCAVIAAITPVTEQGEGTGLGAIAGGILGGVIGNQIGGGSGKDVARIAGIAGGAYAGHQVEKSQRTHTAYDITVRFEDGSRHTIRESTNPVWQVGDKVFVENGKLVPR